MWKCVECGHEEEERWLMCPECTTPEDWARMLAWARADRPDGTMRVSTSG